MTGTTTIPIEAYGERTVVTIVKDHYSNGNARYTLMYANKTDIFDTISVNLQDEHPEAMGALPQTRPTAHSGRADQPARARHRPARTHRHRATMTAHDPKERPVSDPKPLTMTDDQLDDLIVAIYTETDNHQQAFLKSLTRAERTSLLRLSRRAPQGATHLVMDWSGEAWLPYQWADASGGVIEDVDENDIDLGPTPSETDSWRDLIDNTMENTSCTKYVEISAIVGAMS